MTSTASDMLRKLSRRARSLLRRALSTGADRYSLGGRLKTRHRPRAPSLPGLRCLEPEREP
jgi:hypothetical protein